MWQWHCLLTFRYLHSQQPVWDLTSSAVLHTLCPCWGGWQASTRSMGSRGWREQRREVPHRAGGMSSNIVCESSANLSRIENFVFQTSRILVFASGSFICPSFALSWTPSLALSWTERVTKDVKKCEISRKNYKFSKVSKSFQFFGQIQKETFLSSKTHFFMFWNSIFEISHFSRFGDFAARSTPAPPAAPWDSLTIKQSPSNGPPEAVRPSWASYRYSRSLPQA